MGNISLPDGQKYYDPQQPLLDWIRGKFRDRRIAKVQEELNAPRSAPTPPPPPSLNPPFQEREPVSPKYRGIDNIIHDSQHDSGAHVLQGEGVPRGRGGGYMSYSGGSSGATTNRDLERPDREPQDTRSNRQPLRLDIPLGSSYQSQVNNSISNMHPSTDSGSGQGGPRVAATNTQPPQSRTLRITLGGGEGIKVGVSKDGYKLLNKETGEPYGMRENIAGTTATPSMLQLTVRDLIPLANLSNLSEDELNSRMNEGNRDVIRQLRNKAIDIIGRNDIDTNQPLSSLISSYQKKYGLQQTGKLDTATMYHVANTAKSTLEIRDKLHDIRIAQDEIFPTMRNAD